MAENEAVFREHNERVQRDMEALVKQAKAEGLKPLTKNTDMPLHFYCECSDENCIERVIVKPSRYKVTHNNRRRFIVFPGHEVESIEIKITQENGYEVVEKVVDVPESPEKLNPTPIDNT